MLHTLGVYLMILSILAIVFAFCFSIGYSLPLDKRDLPPKVIALMIVINVSLFLGLLCLLLGSPGAAFYPLDKLRNFSQDSGNLGCCVFTVVSGGTLCGLISAFFKALRRPRSRDGRISLINR